VRLFEDDTFTLDDPYFARALALAQRGRLTTSPNPLVGCVIVRDGLIVGEGHHVRAGEPHAEVIALRDAGDAARDAHVYVTLEPCAHFGRTPPCVDALIAAGVACVHIGVADPTRVAGGGAQRLREAGIEVIFAPDPEPFAAVNEAWLKRVATGLPFVTVKLGLTLDAHASLTAHHQARITGRSGAEVTARLRSQHAAVAVGAHTVAVDDPALTIRDARGVPASVQPQRLVLTRHTPPPADAQIFTDGLVPASIVAADSADVSAAAQHAAAVERYALADGVPAMLAAIARLGLDSVLIEAGPALFSALWTTGVIDRLVTVSAGGMAGAQAPPVFVGDPDVAERRVLPRMNAVEAGIVGDVSVTVWNPKGADDER